MALLRKHGVARVVSHNPGEYPVFREATAGFMYLRLHGTEAMYRGHYGEDALDEWARRIDGWARGRVLRAGVPAGDAGSSGPRDVYVYFDNDVDAAAPFDARRLMERLDLAAGFPAPGTKDATQ